MLYRHTQIGWAMLAGPFVVLSVLIPALMDGRVAILLFPFAIAAVIAVLFGTLTVVVDDQQLSARFGIGLIRRNVAVDVIRSVTLVRNPWYYGWGIRCTSVGRLYNVSGLSAVDLLLNDGTHVRVGTDAPEALQEALRRVVTPRAAERGDTGAQEGTGPRRIRSRLASGVGGVVVLMVMAQVYLGMQPPQVTVSPTAFSVRGGGFYGAEVPLGDIADVSLQDTIPRVLRKTNGFNAGDTLRGHFRLDVWGDGQIFINRGTSPYVVVRTRDSFVIVNFRDPQRTRDLYAELRKTR